MPPPRERGIDHLVIAVRDLDSACAQFERLGFTTTPRADRKGGTNNAAIQFQGNYIELFTTRPAESGRTGADSFSFGRYNAGFLQRREGMSMLVFASDNAERDLAELTAKGLTTHGPVIFKSDPADTPGWEKETKFSLTFVTDARTPDAVYFVCQNHLPENFWKASYQRHANTADHIAEVVMVAERPADLAGHFGAMQRPEQVRVEGDALHVTTARGSVTVLTPAAFTRRYEGVAAPSRDPHFAAVRIVMRDLVAARSHAEAAGLASHAAPGRLWLEPKDLGGVLLEMSEG